MIGIAYVYIDYQNQVQQSPVNIIASLLKQLALRVEEAIPELQTLHKDFSSRGERPELRNLLHALISVSARFLATFVILDALDQCDENHRATLLGIIKQLTEAQVKVFTTSRPHLREVREFFHNAVNIEITAETRDIETYLRKRLDVQKRRGDEPTSDAIETFQIGAQGR